MRCGRGCVGVAAVEGARRRARASVRFPVRSVVRGPLRVLRRVASHAPPLLNRALDQFLSLFFLASSGGPFLTDRPSCLTKTVGGQTNAEHLAPKTA